MEKIKNKSTPTILTDSILAGILLAKKHKIIPKVDEKNRVVFIVEGDVERSIKEIYNNSSIGCLDILNSIKSTRSMIWDLKKARGN